MTEKNTVKKTSKSNFSNDWLEDPNFMEWLGKASSNNEARCEICHKTFKLSNMERQALVGHANSKKHKDILERRQSFFKPRETAMHNAQQEKTPSNDNVQMVDLTMHELARRKAEIVWSLKSVFSGFSNNSASNINQVFAAMFPDSKIAKSFQIGLDKLKYICNFRLAPFFKTILTEKLKKSEHYVISYDESMNEDCQMDVLIRYFDEDDKQVKVRYLDSRFLGHSMNVDLFEQFTNAVIELNPSCILQVSMDGPSVNLKFLQKVQDHRKANEQPRLVDIGSCGLHGAFKAGVQSTDWMLKEVLNSAYYILHDSPARRDDYQTVTGRSVLPLNFCSTR